MEKVNVNRKSETWFYYPPYLGGMCLAYYPKILITNSEIRAVLRPKLGQLDYMKKLVLSKKKQKLIFQIKPQKVSQKKSTQSTPNAVLQWEMVLTKICTPKKSFSKNKKQVEHKQVSAISNIFRDTSTSTIIFTLRNQNVHHMGGCLFQ